MLQMHRIATFFSIALLLAANGFAQSAARQILHGDGGEKIAGSVGAIFLQRDDPSSGVLFSDDFTDEVYLNAAQLDSDVQGGVLVDLAARLNCKTAISGRYFQIDGMGGDRSQAVPGASLSYPGAAVPTFADTLDASLSSRLESAELMLQRSVSSWLTIGGGVRYVSLDEAFTGTIDEGTSLELDLSTSSVDNDLIGFQFSIDALLLRRELFDFGVTSNIGLYNNHVSVRATDNFNLLSASASEDSIAMVAELIFGGSVRLTDSITFSSGYQLLWLDGVSTATDQLLGGNFDNGGFLDPASIAIDDSTVFYHGVTATLGFVF